MISLDTLYDELIKSPSFRDATSICGGPHGDYFIKLCRRPERRFLLRNEARVAERFIRYDFCPPLLGFRDFDDVSCLVYRRVPGVSLLNTIFVTKHMVTMVSDTLNRINDTFAKERICQLDPSPNNIIIDRNSNRVWYVDYELCVPFGTKAEIINGFGAKTDEEQRILHQIFQSAGCQYKPEHITEYGDAFNRYMNNKIVADLDRRRHLAGFLSFYIFRAQQYWQRMKRRVGRT